MAFEQALAGQPRLELDDRPLGARIERIGEVSVTRRQIDFEARQITEEVGVLVLGERALFPARRLEAELYAEAEALRIGLRDLHFEIDAAVSHLRRGRGADPVKDIDRSNRSLDLAHEGGREALAGHPLDLSLHEGFGHIDEASNAHFSETRVGPRIDGKAHVGGAGAVRELGAAGHLRERIADAAQCEPQRADGVVEGRHLEYGADLQRRRRLDIGPGHRHQRRGLSPLESDVRDSERRALFDADDEPHLVVFERLGAHFDHDRVGIAVAFVEGLDPAGVDRDEPLVIRIAGAKRHPRRLADVQMIEQSRLGKPLDAIEANLDHLAGGAGHAKLLRAAARSDQ